MLESSSLLQLTMREISYLQSCPCSGTSTSLNGTTPIGYMQHSVTPLSHVLCSTLWHHYVPLLCLMCNQPYSTLFQLLPFNLSFPRIWIRLLPRHLSTSLLFSALLALLCSALHSYTQLHSYTATQLHSYTATYSYTAIQLHSYTAIQLHSYTDRQTDRQTDRDRQYRVHGLASKCTYAGCGHHVYLPRHIAMGMDCHLFAYLADESPLLHRSVYPYILQYSSLSTFIHGLLVHFPNTSSIGIFIFPPEKINVQIGFYLISIFDHDILPIWIIFGFFQYTSGWVKLLVWVCLILLSFVKPVSPNDLSPP